VKLVVDSQSLVWAVDDPSRLSKAATIAIQDLSNELWISSGSIWEISIKVGLGKMIVSGPFKPWITSAIIDLDIHILPITIDYCEVQSKLPHIHRDPFDRMIAAQCLCDRLPVVSSDAVFDQYGVTRIW
jgi:PIN domain nuclease of toxin-antitoxin system